jgi:murein L,D-transpeptidase YcbB/YkuD
MRSLFRMSSHRKFTHRVLPAFAILASALAVAGCARTIAMTEQAQPVTLVHPPAAENTRDVMRQTLAASKGAFAEQLQSFYSARDFEPAWTGDASREKDATALTAILAKAHQQGLTDAEYVVSKPAASTSAKETAAYDFALTEAALRYARDVQQGRVFPGEVYDDVSLPIAHFEGAADLARAAKQHRIAEFFDAHEPQHPGYRNLEKALARYRAIAAEDGWPTLPGSGEIALDGKDPRLATLIKRMSIEDSAFDAIAKPSQAQIHDAVQRFQARHGLAEDGRVRGETLAALNVTAAQRAAQIAANMERWRWLPPQLESRHVMVNAAEQTVRYIRDGKSLLTSRVIVGRKSSPTPITRAEIATVVVNPPWNIPGDIAARDLLPHLKQNANYLAMKHMVVTDGPKGDPTGRHIDWRKVTPADFPYAIQQLPGPGTALGALMLDSPNDFDVYLHDTPGKQFFAQQDREISNGCVRVQQIFPLASLALKDDPEQGQAMLREIVKQGKTQRLALSSPLPVYFLYWTAIADADGNVEFRPDHYGRDGILTAALSGKRVKPITHTAEPMANDDPTP